jgi:hypothetical protein
MMKSMWRTFQDDMRNRGWRIAWIPHDDGTKLIWYPTNWWALAGAAGFLGGLGLMTVAVVPGLATSIGSLALMLFAIWRPARRRRRNWVQTTANCVDLERRPVLGRDLNEHGWEARMTCEFEFHGQSYRATPVVHYRGFRNESRLLEYLASHIANDGRCRLYINPANPLECELASEGIKDWLLH